MFVRIAMFLILTHVAAIAMHGKDCVDLARGICVRNKNMNAKQCEAYSGILTESCFSTDRTRFRFQCQFAAPESGVSIMYLDEKSNEDQALLIRTKLRGKLSKLESFISRKPDLKRGEMLYNEKGCSVCHGTGGKGDGPVAASLAPKPGDFSIGFLHGDDLDSIMDVIASGVPNTAMAPYRGVLEDQEIADLARYVKYLSGKRDALPRKQEKDIKPKGQSHSLNGQVPAI